MICLFILLLPTLSDATSTSPSYLLVTDLSGPNSMSFLTLSSQL